MLIQTITGSQNFPEGSTKLHVFFVPTRQRMGQEIHIGQLARGANPDVPASASNVQRFAAWSGASATLGEWTRANYDIPEGVVLKVYGSKRQSLQGQNMGEARAAVYLQMRSGAALNRIAFSMLQNPKSPIASATIEGRFDILNMQQLAQLGVGLNVTTLALLNERQVERLFSFSVLDRPTEARREVKTTTVKNSEGQSVVIQKATAKRAVKL